MMVLCSSLYVACLFPLVTSVCHGHGYWQSKTYDKLIRHACEVSHVLYCESMQAISARDDGIQYRLEGYSTTFSSMQIG